MGTGREGTGTGTGGGLITLHSHPGSRKRAGMGPGYKASRPCCLCLLSVAVMKTMIDSNLEGMGSSVF